MIPRDPVTFRPLIASDQDFLWQMLRLAVFTPDGDPPPTAASVQAPALARYVQDWMQHEDFGVLAEIGDRAVGAAWARLFPHDAPGYGFVAPEIPELSIAVVGEHRNQGIGGGLLDLLIRRAKARAPGLSLSVSPRNPARQLYLRKGFKTVRQTGAALVMLLTWPPSRRGA